jgi:hypothetical protein
MHENVFAILAAHKVRGECHRPRSGREVQSVLTGKTRETTRRFGFMSSQLPATPVGILAIRSVHMRLAGKRKYSGAFSNRLSIFGSPFRSAYAQGCRMNDPRASWIAVGTLGWGITR